MHAKSSQPMPLSITPEADGISAVLISKGIPLTRQRRLVWEYYLHVGKAATIAEAAADLQPAGVSQATVYRAIAMFAELGLLHRVQVRSGEACYTAALLGHRHPLVCGECRRVVEFVGDDDLSELQRRLELETGFMIYGHHLEVYGLCPQCVEKRSTSRWSSVLR
ncbi:MAG: transcriptional repressor [Actinobacteria bacterium]|nr:transcriptional repressor [Actinomycetota bacterium]